MTSERVVTLTDSIQVHGIRWLAGDDEIVGSAWTSTTTDETKIKIALEKEGRVEGTIEALARDHHGSPFEDGFLAIHVTAPIFVMREWQRHRIMSYSEMSQRYVELVPVFWFPSRERGLVKAEGHKQIRPKYESLPPTPEGNAEYWEMHADWLQSCEFAWSIYQKYLKRGRPREVASRILGHNVYTQCRVRPTPLGSNLPVRHHCRPVTYRRAQSRQFR
jgi:thymidylate synthase (FAD)